MDLIERLRELSFEFLRFFFGKFEWIWSELPSGTKSADKAIKVDLFWNFLNWIKFMLMKHRHAHLIEVDLGK